MNEWTIEVTSRSGQKLTVVVNGAATEAEAKTRARDTARKFFAQRNPAGERIALGGGDLTAAPFLFVR
jgi:hypothetical protein